MAVNTTEKKIIEVRDVSKSFKKRDKQNLLVLANINFLLYENQFVAILGKSGSGKSTLLDAIAGLSLPTKGGVYFKKQRITQPFPGLAMVFQDSALMPWLTALQNVELGLEAQGIPKDIRRERALKTIDIVGMDGFESAYPRELSGGMRQRIGLARALAVNPDVLLMDEPFSALDVLTAENLRSDLLDLWLSAKTNLKSILLVTHNIEEATLLADRILVFDSNPGTIRADLKVDLPHPRNDQDAHFRQVVDHVYTLMTTHRDKTTAMIGPRHKVIGLRHRLPAAHISELIGLVEALHSSPNNNKDNKVDLPQIANEQHLDINELFPLTEALEILGFAHVSQGDIELTTTGETLAEADILGRKQLFAKQLLRHVPLIQHIRQVLDERPSHTASENRFLSELEDHLSKEAASKVLKIAIDWGRYAELFAYDANSGQLSLEDPN